MATGLQELEVSAPAPQDSDADGLYEVVDGQVVEKPLMGARESILQCG
jgi:hypothetical protein